MAVKIKSNEIHQSVKVPEPIFKVKKNVDLFDLYGSNETLENKKKKNIFANSSDEISDDLQSMRIRLAVLKAKEQCEETEGNQIRQEAIDEVDSNLREILALESPCTNETLPKSPNKQKDVKKNTLPTKKSITVSTKIEKDKLDGQIGSQIDTIVSTYSKIFQALIVLINEHHLNQHVPRSSTEVDKINKRSREFEVRLHRQMFEAKQRTIVLKATLVKYQLHTNNKTKNAANKSLYQALKCYSSILNSYLSHLPLSGRNILPSSLNHLFEILGTVGYHAKDLSFKKADQIICDTHRLSAVFNQFHKKTNKDKDEYDSKSSVVGRFGSTENLKIIDNLAKQKFGKPPPALDISSTRSPRRKSNIKRDVMMKSSTMVKSPRTFSGLRAPTMATNKPKEIIPKPTKLLQDRARLAKQKRYGIMLDTDFNEQQCEAEDKIAILKTIESINEDEISNDVIGSFNNSKKEHDNSRVIRRPSILNPNENISISRNQDLPINSSHSSAAAISDKSSLKSRPSLSRYRQSSITHDSEEELEKQGLYSKSSLKRSPPPSDRRKDSIFDDLIKEDIRKDNINIRDNRLRNETLDDIDSVKDDALVRHRISNAGFGNMISLGSEEKLRALNRFSASKGINSSPFYTQGDKRRIDISTDELNHIISHKQNFERELANYYFGEKTEHFKLNSHQENPLKVIRDISQKVMDDVIENVCHEMLTSDIVTDLILKELQN